MLIVVGLKEIKVLIIIFLRFLVGVLKELIAGKVRFSTSLKYFGLAMILLRRTRYYEFSVPNSF